MKSSVLKECCLHQIGVIVDSLILIMIRVVDMNLRTRHMETNTSFASGSGRVQEHVTSWITVVEPCHLFPCFEPLC